MTGDLSLNRPYFGSSSPVHAGSQQRTLPVCFVDSSNFAAEWYFAILLEQVVVADGDTVVKLY